MKTVIVIFLVLILASCNGKNDASETYNNGDFKIELLFEHEGCKMYRFNDGRTIYWSDCSGKIQSDYYQSTGKSGHTVHQETITTN